MIGQFNPRSLTLPWAHRIRASTICRSRSKRCRRANCRRLAAGTVRTASGQLRATHGLPALHRAAEPCRSQRHSARGRRSPYLQRALVLLSGADFMSHGVLISDHRADYRQARDQSPAPLDDDRVSASIVQRRGRAARASNWCLPRTAASSSTTRGAIARSRCGFTTRRGRSRRRRRRRSPFHGVLAVGDRPAILAARAAERLGLPGNPPDAAAASGNKLERAARLAAAGLPVPSYFTVPRPNWPARRDDPRIEFPCVLKPLGLSGSRGVIRADSPTEFAARVRSHPRAARARRCPRRRGPASSDDPRRAIHRGTRIRGRRRADGRRAAGLHDFRQARPARWAVLRGNDLCDADVARRRDTRRAGVGDSAGRRRARALARSRSTRSVASVRPGSIVLEIAARPIGGLCSKALRFAEWRRRSSRCCCAMPSAKTSRASTRETSRVGSDDDSDSQAGTAEARRWRGARPWTCRTSRTVTDHREDRQRSSRCPEVGQLPGVHLRARSHGRGGRCCCSCRACAPVVHDRLENRDRTRRRLKPAAEGITCSAAGT